jgi:hypothetical protein
MSEGVLTIYPTDIQRVPRQWKAQTHESCPELVPDEARDLHATTPELTEPPVTLRPSKVLVLRITSVSRDGQP